MAEHPDDKHKPSLEKILEKSFLEMGQGENKLAEQATQEVSQNQTNEPEQNVSTEPQSYEYNKVYKTNQVSTMQVKREGLKEAKVTENVDVKSELSSKPGDDFDIEW